ncbi:MAG: hypothetical protein LBJ31_08000 [Treponema sp.]|nr:hypothetical protein [Treponema sp.]
MIKLDEFGIKLVKKGEDAHYSIRWSPLKIADRWTINSTVPAVAGIYEVYWMDDHEHLRLLSVGLTHYGGLRSELRRLTDPELNGDKEARKTLEDEEIWFRYAPCNSASMMADVIWFFRTVYFPEKNDTSHSGRFKKIYMNESAPDKLIWVP